MSRLQTPILDTRDARQVFEELMARHPAYLPEWTPAKGKSGWALLQIFSRYMEIILNRLNQAPDKNFLAFLDMLGLSLLPAQAARAPVVFQPLPVPVDGRIPAKTRVGAKISGREEPVVFETEGAIAMAAARLVEVVTLWPTRDEYADHSQAVAGGRPFTLFHPRHPVVHEFYVAHDTLLAFAGKATVEIEFELAVPGNEPLKIVWEYWDGQIWQSFKSFDSSDSQASQDGTDGLTRSGVVTLRAECGESKETMLNGIKAYWIRGKLDQPLPPDPARVLPEVDRIQIRCVIERQIIEWGVEEKEIGGDLVIQGTVKDRHGVPLAGLKVFLYAPNVFEAPETSSDSQGNFIFSNNQISPHVSYLLKFIGPLAPPFSQEVHIKESAVQVDLIATLGSKVDQGFSDGIKLDISKTVYPLGQSPLPGNVFYFSSQEIFSKPGANMKLWVKFVPPASLAKDPNDAGDLISGSGIEIMWEYWNGRGWKPLTMGVDVPFQNTDPSHDPTRMTGGESEGTLIGGEEGVLDFKVPSDILPVEINNVEALWMRARLGKGTFSFERTISYQMSDPADSNNKLTFQFPIVEMIPPAIADMRLGYNYRSPWERPEHCLTNNDFQFEEHSHDVRWPGGNFPPFRPVSDTTPVFYLGFDRPLPNDFVSLFLNCQESDMAASPLIWESWDGKSWQELSVVDETAGLRRPGTVSFIPPDVSPRPEATVKETHGSELILTSPLEAAKFKPGDQVVILKTLNAEPESLTAVKQVAGDTVVVSPPLSESYPNGILRLAALPRFGISRDWVRARMKDDGAPAEQEMQGIHLNAAWAKQLQTFDNEVLGSGAGQPNQVVFLRYSPVLPGEQIEVRELEGERAEVEYPILRDELLKGGISDEHIRAVVHPRSGRVREVWVRWAVRPHLFFSGPEDRHCVLERASGRLMFGDARNGRLPTVGANNIRALRYEAGGGLIGNVPRGAIDQLLSGAPTQGVTNPKAGEGGADGELPESVKTRGPLVLRHRGRSLTTGDYEALARDASPAVAVTRALPTTASNGRPAPGAVTVIIVPQSQDLQPQPSFELRRLVHDYLVARAPVSVDPHNLAVIGPTYLPVGVHATVVPLNLREAGIVEGRVRSALASFLHPLSGGPEGCGWPFGRDVYLSDVAAVLESIKGVDYVKALDLLVHDTPQGESASVPTDRIVVAGPIQIEMQGANQ